MKPLQKVADPRRRSNGGFTLVEVMIAATLFALLAGGISAGILQARRLAEQNVYRVSALTIAQGYLEQMKGMVYDQLSTDPDTAIPTELNYGDPDPLYPETWNEKQIDIHDTPGNPDDDMRMWVRPTITQTAYRKMIQIDLRWETPRGAGESRIFEGTFRSIRSTVP
ncbi:MAG: prepilin-type N-terminal cleavage/methylation domain-containing protein [Opitutales bacterium]